MQRMCGFKHFIISIVDVIYIFDFTKTFQFVVLLLLPIETHYSTNVKKVKRINIEDRKDITYLLIREDIKI